MADFDAIRQVFDEELNTNWISTPIKWPNVPTDIPEEAAWIESSISFADRTNVTIGATRKRHFGDYIIRVFVPLNTGTGSILSIATQLIQLFENKTLSTDILTYAGSIKNLGDVGYGAYQANVYIPFTAED